MSVVGVKGRTVHAASHFSPHVSTRLEKGLAALTRSRDGRWDERTHRTMATPERSLAVSAEATVASSSGSSALIRSSGTR